MPENASSADCAVNEKFVITRLVLASSAEIQITEGRFESLRLAWQGVSRVLSIEEKFDLVMENYAELEVELLRCTAQMFFFQEVSWDRASDLRNLVNRRLVNLLSAVRMYFDQVSHDLSVLQENDAPFESIRRQEHHAHLGYRVMEELRNHAQHRSLPVHVVSYAWTAPKEGTRTFTTHFCVSMDELRSEGGFKPAVFRDLSALGDAQIQLKPFVRAYLASLTRIHVVVRGAVASKLNQWVAHLESAIHDFQELYGEEVAGLAAARIRLEDGQPRGVIDSVGLFADQWLRLRRLVAKNACMRGLELHEISSS